MDYVLAPFVWLLGLFASIVLWVITQLLWIVLWLLLPLAVAAFVALRIAERVLGREKARVGSGAYGEIRIGGFETCSAMDLRAGCRAGARSLLVRALRDLAQRRQFAVAATLVAVAVRLGTALAPTTRTGEDLIAS
jgi:hypothetical protein